jgi:hypothetical protein
LENEPEITVTAKLKKLVAQFANSKAAVHVRPAESIRKVAKREEAFHPLVLRQFA